MIDRPVCAAALGRAILSVAALGGLLGVAVPDARAQASRTAADGVYSEAQARRGATLYGEHCENCHGAGLTGTEFAPAVGGAEWAARWQNRTLGDLYGLMRNTMPLNSPGGLSASQNADILAFMLMRSRLPAGPADLPAEADALSRIRLSPPGP